MMSYLPKNKHDIDFCKKIDEYPDKLIIDNLNDLLQWTEDINYPITNCIHNRISQLNIKFLIIPIKNILEGNDSLLKYSIMQSLILKLNKKDFHYFYDELEKISINPTENDKEEGLDELAKDLIISLEA